jgi:hypothetical protein
MIVPASVVTAPMPVRVESIQTVIRLHGSQKRALCIGAGLFLCIGEMNERCYDKHARAGTAHCMWP